MKTLRQLGIIFGLALALFFWPVTLCLMFIASYALGYGGLEDE